MKNKEYSLKESLRKAWLSLGLISFSVSALAFSLVGYTDYQKNIDQIEDDLNVKSKVIERRISAELLVSRKLVAENVIKDLKKHYGLNEIKLEKGFYNCDKEMCTTIKGDILSASRLLSEPTSEYDSIRISVSTPSFLKSLRLAYLFVVFLPIFSLFLIGVLIQHNMIQNSLVKPIESLVGASYRGEQIPTNWPLEFKNLAFRLDEAFKIRDQATMGRIASQVSHDIRSPLSALEMISSQFEDIPEEKRVVLRNSINRIRDIANSLSQKNEPNAFSSIAVKDENLIDLIKNQVIQNELLMPIIDMIVTEKRLQFRDKLNIQIDFNQTIDSYGLFSKINVIEFKRLLSNVINNSIEALEGKDGSVLIELSNSENNNLIIIKDNGKGIKKEIIGRLGERGVTFDKSDGSGLGLYHAKATTEAFGGHFRISSVEGSGTEVKIILPKQKAPSWFVPILELSNISYVIVFDDDQSIHEIWKKRLDKFSASNLILLHFSNPSELKAFYRKKFAELENAIFLMDYEILRYQETGLDLIEEFGIQNQSVLVTSRFEEKALLDRCVSLGVRLIPKSMSGFVPIKV
jgi:signal transduction histidine kinase